MSRPPKLNWDTDRGKWKVVYRGRKYRFEGGTGKSDRDARRRAEADWKALKAQIDHEAEQTKPHRAEYQHVMAEWTSVLTWSVDHGDELTASVARGKLRDLEDRLCQRIPPPLTWADRFFAGPAPLENVNQQMEHVYRAEGLTPAKLVAGPEPAEHALWRDRLSSQEQRCHQIGSGDTFAENVELFLAGKRTEVSAGQLSASRADSLRIYLNAVMEFTGRTTSVRRIDEATLSAFRNHLLQRVAGDQISDYHARDVLAAFKLFVRWLAANTDKLESLPRNIDGKQLSISVSQRKAKTLTREQIQSLLKAATDRTKLYVLLGANCAMTQGDMSDLQQTEVCWSKGIITRKRSKTSNCENVPVVSYRLWPTTFALLQQERSENSERVLLTRDGQPLRTEEINSRQRLRKTDAVRLAVRRLSRKTDIPFSIKMLKKTAATLLRNHREFQGLESLFLDHAPNTVAARHYAGIPQELLDEAVAWLGTELGIG